ncbi:glycoside hydrolase family 65 protein [Nakamurella sp.]|uniref:glycoside hydrolase family 65 protein n=1 Tax=Nakamurella sp. TaxID=1869182 RepID=UPI0037841430
MRASCGRPDSSGTDWLVTESGFDPTTADVFETLFTVGNGRIGTRGVLEEGRLGDRSGVFINGVFDHHDAQVRDLVNAPDWLDLAVFVDGTRMDVQSCAVVEHERTLDFRGGVLHRRTVFEDDRGRRTTLRTVRFASLVDPDLCGVRVEITTDSSALVTVESGIDGRRTNLELLPVYPADTVFDPATAWQKWSQSRHLDPVARGEDGDALYLEVRTLETDITIGYAASVCATIPPVRRTVRRGSDRIAEQLDIQAAAGEAVVLDKLVVIGTSRRGRTAVRADALARLAGHRRSGFDAGLAASREVWDNRWADCDVQIVGDADATRAVRFGIYHLLIAADETDPTVNIGAKSLSGEGYRGHVFWDTEVMMLPFFLFTRPRTARNLLEYRHHTLDGARQLARETGTAGARYPWESADTGREECPVQTPDGLNRFWTRDQEIHVSADVAYGILTYLEATGDESVLLDFGAEILFETSRFWADRAEWDEVAGRFALRTVMGPDEFHSHVDNNAFTNHLARWHLQRAAEVYDELAARHPAALAEIVTKIGLLPREPLCWRQVADGIAEPRVVGGVVEQFDGYFERRDVPITEWDGNDMPKYPDGLHHFNCEDTMLLKQPDVVMLMHMLPGEFDRAVKLANFEFYEKRTLHKSSLSPAIHAIMGIEVGDARRAVQYFTRSAFVDLHDNQGNTRDGMHIASAGGTWQIVVHGFGGFRVIDGQMHVDPWLPEGWQQIRFRLYWQGSPIAVAIGHAAATFDLIGDRVEPVTILVRGEPVVLTAGGTTVVQLDKEWAGARNG